MSGKLNRSRKIKRLLRRYNFTIIFLISGFILPAIIIVAIVDFVSTAKSKDALMHNAALRSELSQFVLALREDESASLAKFPMVYGDSRRSLQAVPIAKPFFTYFLNRGNAKYFESSQLHWEAPASCALDFGAATGSENLDGKALRACLAYLPNDSTGNYLYFSLRYPSEEVSRHEQGSAFASADHVVFDLRSPHRKIRLQLVYEPATLAIERYPSQQQRFVGLHEITAYLGDDPRRPTHAVSGQAFEQTLQGGIGKTKKFITLLVRIDPSIILDPQDADSQGPEAFRSVHAAVSVYLRDPAKKRSVSAFDIPLEKQGTAVMSLEKLYLANVPSKAKLVLSRYGDDGPNQIWSSDSIAEEAKRPSGFQAASDKWAEWIVSKFGYKSLEATTSQQLGKDSPTLATLKQDGVLLPDVATRSFLYLSVALLVILGALSYLSVSLLHLRRIFSTSYLITVHPREDIPLFKHEKGNNEISRLGRIVYLLISKNRSHTLRLQKKMRQEQNEQIERSRIEQEHVRNRKAILDAIGHEIKSPLQSLLTKIPRESDANRDVERMKRAVVALDLATSVETGLQASMMVNKYQDIAVYVSTFARNTAAQGIVYDGPGSGVIAFFDPIALDTVFDHIVSNAFRLKNPGSKVEILLKKSVSAAQIEIYNDGPSIESGKEEAIFMLGVSSKSENGNLGQGLFAARAQMVGMRGSIKAENRPGGVVFILYLSLKPE
jgi:signal transduction histidine kinase